MNLKKMNMNKKGVNLSEMPSIAITFVLIAVVVAIGAYILSSINTTAAFTANSTASNATGYGSAGLQTLAQWLPIIALIVAAVILISLLLGAFRGRVE